ncbi:hypothetical protein [Streptomyces sp. 039-1]|uniref:hypothetical protein n=1 Tax=Streptomyces sp. 039-1 TaxID=2789263 RepID=UPI0039F5F665
MGDEAQSSDEHTKIEINGIKIGGQIAHAHNLLTVAMETGGVLAAGAFFKALAEDLGTRLAGTIDSGTRAAVRRFLRRQEEEASGSAIAGFDLRTEQGWRISMSRDLSAEALAQLGDLCEAEPPAPGMSPLLINYGRAGWEAWGGVDGDYVRYRWEPESKRWATRPLS